MNPYGRAIRAEMLKMKGTLALGMVVIAPFSIAALNVLRWTMATPAHRLDLSPATAWQLMGQGMLVLWCLLMLPLFVTLETALVAGLEHGNGQWKHLLALPLPRGAHYLGKFAVAALMLVAAHALLYVLIVPTGWVLMLVQPAMGIAGPPALGALWQPALASLGAGLLMLAIQAWVALRWQSFTVAVSLGIVATIAGFFIGRSHFGRIFPWSLPLQMFADGSHGMPLALGLGGGLLAVLLGLADLLRRESP